MGKAIRLDEQTAFNLMQSFVQAYQARRSISDEIGQFEFPGVEKQLNFLP
jgi:hypothetical protein